MSAFLPSEKIPFGDLVEWIGLSILGTLQPLLWNENKWNSCSSSTSYPIHRLMRFKPERI